jgi:glycosyltransferase involved in cell wall biosynthesis
LALLEANTLTGPAKNLLQFANSMRAGGGAPPLEVFMAVLRRSGVPNTLIDWCRRSAVPVYPIDERHAYDLAVLSQLSSLFHKLRPDLIQTHGVKSHCLVRLAGLYRRAPWVAFHHGYAWPDLRTRCYNHLDRWSLRAARLALTVSQPFRDDLARIGVAPGRIQVVHNAIDPDWGACDRSPEAARALRSSLGVAPEEKVLLVVGRLSREKDHVTLLRAVHALGNAAPPFRLRIVVVGDGPERSAILEAAGALGLSGSLLLTGHVASAAPYFGIADVAVLCSRSEGSPNALLEAMAASVPIVATAVGGIPEMVSHQRNGLLIPPADPAALAAALRSVLGDPTLGRDLAECARQTLASRFAPAARARRILDCYSTILPPGRMAAPFDERAAAAATGPLQ